MSANAQIPSERWFNARLRYEVRDTGHATPCWLWLGAKTHGGYGRLGFGTRSAPQNAVAHRVYWQREHGPVPEGLDLDHLCRQKSCVNPDHLEPVTRSVNLRRRLRCERLDIDDVRAIRASREPGTVLAERYGVSPTTISHVRLRRTWTHIADEVAA